MTHMDLVMQKERGERVGYYLAIVIAPTVWCAGIVVCAHLLGRVFGVRVHDRAAAMMMLAGLWAYAAIKVWRDGPPTGDGERMLRRRKAREADARGYCVEGANCSACGGMRPARKDGV